MRSLQAIEVPAIARPGPVFRCQDHLSRNGIQVDVGGDVDQVAAERQPAQPRPGQAGCRVRPERRQRFAELGLFRASENVIVAAHHAVRVDLDREPLPGLAQGIHKSCPLPGCGEEVEPIRGSVGCMKPAGRPDLRQWATQR